MRQEQKRRRRRTPASQKTPEVPPAVVAACSSPDPASPPANTPSDPPLVRPAVSPALSSASEESVPARCLQLLSQIGKLVSRHLFLTPVYWPWMQRIEKLSKEDGSVQQWDQLLLEIEFADNTPAELVELVQSKRRV